MRRDRLHYLYPIIALGTLAAATSWLARITQPPAEADRKSASTLPDMVVENLTLQRFDATGRQQYVFSASEMRHFAVPEHTVLSRPELLFLAGSAPVAATATQGTVSADGESVLLEGNVVVTREASEERPAAQLETEALTVWPDTEKVTGNLPVRYAEGSDLVVAGRFVADNLAGTLELDGGLKATFNR